MKQNYIYLLIALVLAVLVYFLVIRKESGSFKGDEQAFGVKDTTDISRIFLADLSGRTIEVERSETGWVLSKEKTPVRQELISTLLVTFQQMEVHVPVAESMYNKVVRDIAGSHTKVEIYNRAGKKIRSYYVGPVSTTYRGNFMLVEGSETPFVVHIPGFEGFISSRFELNELNWKDRTVFAWRPDGIARVEVEYPRVPDSSFVIERTREGAYTFTNRGEVQPAFNPEIGNYYLNQFKRLNCELLIDNSYKLDSLKRQQPICVIRVNGHDGREQKASFYYRAVNYRTKMQFTYEGKEINFDLDKFYGIIHQGSELALIQNFVFGKVFIGPSYFYRTRPGGSNVLVDDIMKDSEGETINLMPGAGE